MAGQDDGPGQVPQVRLEEDRGVVIEVVGRLVEEQRGGTADQQGGQGQAAALAAGDLTEAPAAREPGEIEASQDQPGPAVSVPRAVILRTFQPLSVLGQQACGGGRSAGTGTGQRPGEPVELGQVLPGLAQRVVQHVADRRDRVERHLLRQEAGVPRADHGAAVWFVRARQQAEQRGLPHAVLADQADALAGGTGQADAVQHPARAQRPDEVMGQQGRLGHVTPLTGCLRSGPPGSASVAGVEVSDAHIVAQGTGPPAAGTIINIRASRGQLVEDGAVKRLPPEPAG